MPIRISREQLANIVSGATVPSDEKLQASGAEFDSRNVRGGELFICLKGANTHGHQFLDAVFAAGAGLALVEDPALLKTHPHRNRLVQVKDSLLAFHALASWWRDKLALKVLAVTGSVGKTTVKEMAAAILMQSGIGVYSEKSFNNHVGVPYTILKADSRHGWAVLEMGMNHPGEIALLSKMARPDVAMVTTVSPAHIGNMGGLQQIADEKVSIAEGLGRDGVLVTNSDIEILEATAAAKFSGKRKTFGRGQADARLLSVTSRGFDGISMSFTLPGIAETQSAELSIVGAHNGMNALGAALGARELLPNLSPEMVVAGLRAFRAPLMRLNQISLASGAMVLDDSYNANPTSMLAFLETGKALAAGKRLGLVLGDMLELGEFSQKYHQEIGQAAAKVGASFLIGVGPESAQYLTALTAQTQGVQAKTPEEAAAVAVSLGFDILLVKGSRGIGLDRTVSAVVKQFGTTYPHPPDVGKPPT